MAHDVFISYSSKDKLTADAVCATLESKGVRCWIAPRDVLPGEEYAAALVNALHSSRLMVLVFSSGANQSPQVLREVERAVSKGLAILPVRIEDVAPSAAMEFYIASRHWLDALTPPIERHLAQLADTVKLLLARLQAMPEGAEFVSEMDLPVSGATQAASAVAPEPPQVQPIEELFAPRVEEAAQSIAVPTVGAAVIPAAVVPTSVAEPIISAEPVRQAEPTVAAAAARTVTVPAAQVPLTTAENRIAGFFGGADRTWSWIAAIAFFAAVMGRLIISSMASFLQREMHLGMASAMAAPASTMITAAFGSIFRSESFAIALFSSAILCACTALGFRYVRNWIAAAVLAALANVLIMQGAYEMMSIRFPGSQFFFILNTWVANAAVLAALAYVVRRFRPTLLNIFYGAFAGSILAWILLNVLAMARGYSANISVWPFAWYFVEDALFALLFWGIVKIGSRDQATPAMQQQ